jgi:glycosyltransferase involved in cell wall biosynthesis
MLKHRPNIIYTTGGPASAHLSGLLLAKLFHRPVMCEFEDPLSGDGIGRNQKSNKYLTFVEKIILNNATISIYCTRSAAENAKKKYPKANIIYIYPGSPPQIYPKLSIVNKSKKFRFVHLGSLYQTRNFDTLLEAIKIISENQFDILNKISIENVGHLNADIRERLIQRTDLVKLTPLMPRLQALKYAANCDFLLLVQNNDERSQSTIPFKIYDYLHLGIPIFGLIGNNVEIREILENHGHIVCDVSSSLSVAEKLDEILKIGDFRPKKSEMTSEAAAARMVSCAKSL